MSKTERQKREEKIWNKFIQPLIEEYGLNHLKYTYMDWEPNYLKHKEGPLALRLVHGHQSFETSFMRNDEIYHHGTIELIEWLSKKAQEEKKLPLTGEGNYPRIQREDVLPIFKTHMRLHFEDGILPYLLEQVAKQYNFTTDISNQDEKKLRPNQRHKIECEKVATKLWKKYPTMTIADMIMRDEINKDACEGNYYTDKTLRKWIKDLCPNAKPGRPKKS